MSKAVLIINNCTECPFIGYDVFTNQPCCIDVGSETDRPREIYDDIDIDEERPDWCPLVLIPNRINYQISANFENGTPCGNYADGWNACLDALEGEENE